MKVAIISLSKLQQIIYKHELMERVYFRITVTFNVIPFDEYLVDIFINFITFWSKVFYTLANVMIGMYVWHSLLYVGVCYVLIYVALMLMRIFICSFHDAC
jgi:hypothetical protein